MTQALNVVLAQLTPQLRRTNDNIETMVGTIEERPEADLVLFPELFMSGYTTVGLEELAVDPEGPEVGRVAQIAKDNSTAVVFGAPERFGGGFANSAIYIDRNGTIAGIYRKAFLFGSEREAYVPGDELLVVDLGGSKAGLMICFDVEFPEVARALAQAGADVLLTISANMEPFERDHHVRQSNFSTACIRPRLPSWIRSSSGSPNAWYFLAIDTTRRRLDCTKVRCASSPVRTERRSSRLPRCGEVLRPWSFPARSARRTPPSMA